MLAPLCLLAQQGEAPTIRANVPLVLLPVTVTENGKPVDGLQPQDFTVSDEGVRQQVHLDTPDTVFSPISMVIAVQTSSLSSPALARIQQVSSMVRPILAGDRGQVAILAYDREIRELMPFTFEADRIEKTFARLVPRTPKQGILLDTMERAIEMLKKQPENNRRVIVYLGESRDRGSKAPLNHVAEMAQRANVAIYPVTYSAQKIAWLSQPEDLTPMPGGPDYLGGFGELARFGKTDTSDTLARTTGGHQLGFLTQQRLEQVLQIAGDELHNQYLLSFAPLDPIPNRYRRVQVKVPSHPKAVVRARPGYWP